MSNHVQKPKTFVMRGYVRERPDGRFVGVCLRPGLIVEASSAEDALDKLHALIQAYANDSINDGTLECMMQRAPARFYLEYWTGRVRRLFRNLNGPFNTFTETRTLPQHA